jgi:hypothetical protein
MSPGIFNTSQVARVVGMGACALLAASSLLAAAQDGTRADAVALRTDGSWTGLRVTLKNGREATFTRGDIARVDYLYPAATPGPVSTGPSPVGVWAWVSGQMLVIQGDGTCQVYLSGQQINACAWVSLGGGRYRLTHRNGGYVDNVTLSANGNALDGVNNTGFTLHGTRTATTSPAPPPSPVGRWNWVSGQVLVIQGDGTCQVYLSGQQINACAWVSLGGGRYRLTHRDGGYVDNVTLSANGSALDGVNNTGFTLHGARQ